MADTMHRSTISQSVAPHRMLPRLGLAFAALLALLQPLAALTQNNYTEEYSKLIKSAQIIKIEGTALFGDSVNLYMGATEFTATDVTRRSVADFKLPA